MVTANIQRKQTCSHPLVLWRRTNLVAGVSVGGLRCDKCSSKVVEANWATVGNLPSWKRRINPPDDAEVDVVDDDDDDDDVRALRFTCTRTPIRPSLLLLLLLFPVSLGSSLSPLPVLLTLKMCPLCFRKNIASFTSFKVGALTGTCLAFCCN